MMERWKPVVGFPGYEVSDRGRVRSYRMPGRAKRLRTRPVLMHPTADKYGYRRVMLCGQGKVKAIAADFDISRSAVCLIGKGRTYKRST